jgi:hypothetical protein
VEKQKSFFSLQKLAEASLSGWKKIINLNANLDCRIKRNRFHFLPRLQLRLCVHEIFIKLFLFSFLFHRSGNDRGGVFLVPMHGGIWTLCINLRDDEIRELSQKGFPAYPACFNYLAGNLDNSRSGGSDEPRADWQHSESQSPIRPHLSRYNRNVLASINPTLILLYGILLSLITL